MAELEVKEEEGSKEFEDLVKEGEDLEAAKTEDESTEDESKEEAPPTEQPDFSSRLDALENSVAEKDAEIVFLRGQLAKQTKGEPAKEADDFDIADLVSRLTDPKAPEKGVKAIMEIADKIAEKKFAKLREETSSLVSGSDMVRTAKEADRNAVLADFEEYVGDDSPHQTKFLKRVAEIYSDMQRNTGREYVKGGIYHAAATAKVEFDKAAARAAGTRNGVTKVRPMNDTANTVSSAPGDYTTAKSINAIPDGILSPREKSAARALVKRMGITEKEWIANFIETEKEAG